MDRHLESICRGSTTRDDASTLTDSSELGENFSYEICRDYFQIGSQDLWRLSKKGTIQIGSDADLVVVDPKKEKTIRAEKCTAKPEISMYMMG